ncbi:MAG: carbon-nitrogen hydrolase family protein [Hyphomicrobiales bacterium]
MNAPARTEFRAALVQMCTGRNIAQNIADASDMIVDAVRDGAEFVSTPETTHFMELSGRRLFETIKPQDEDPGVSQFAKLADKLNIWLNIGSLAVKVQENKAANRSFLFSPRGEVHATYDKIHMFDVDLEGRESYRESKNYRAGDSAVLTRLPWGNLGMTICYDLRFPHLYRKLAQLGANIITVPSAFTEATGKAHWHSLLRARAIETGCFILAAAQGGLHENGRQTYGHSVIIAPWGEILAEGEKNPCILSANIDITESCKMRMRIPSLSDAKFYGVAGEGGAVLGTLKAVS